MIFLTPLRKAPEGSDMKVRGSMTVFAALLFMLVASLLFALLEAARVNMLEAYANMTSEMAVESVFAEYQPGLWEDYHLLCLDGAYGGTAFSEEYVTGALDTRIRMNLDTQGDESRIMELAYTSAIPEEYQVLTDGNGRVFLQCISDYMQENLPLMAVQALYERYAGEQAIEEGKSVDDSVQNAKEALEEVQRQKKVRTQNENPIDTVLSCKQSLLLGMVVKDVESLSAQKLVQADCLQKRVLQSGTNTQIPEVEWYDRILVLEYADNFFSDYSAPQNDRALAYELEYVVCGKASDRENLEAVVERLLLAREAANVIHIMLNQEKRLVISEAAVALAGATANPAVVKVVEYGLIGAWAYAESILDIRALLCGDRIALIKNEEQWTSSLMNLSQILEGSLCASDCEGGWSYQDYLKGFLLTMTERNLAYRMMDVMEQNIRRTYAYRNCRMDHMLSAASYMITYEADSLFWNFSILPHNDIGSLQYQMMQSFSYY